MEKNYLATFAFYDEKGRRLGIFAEIIVDSLSISIITCSKQDMFSKKKSRELYEMWEDSGRKHPDIHPMTFNISLKDKTTPRKEFIIWCRENFYSKMLLPVTLSGMIEGLVRGEELNNKDFRKKIKKAMSCPTSSS